MSKDDVIDVLPIGSKAEFKDVLRFGSNILEGTFKGVVQGVAGTAEDAFKSTVELGKGNVGEAAKIAVDRVTNIGIGTLRTVQSGVAITEATVKSVVTDEPFITHDNEVHLTRLCQLGVYTAAGAALASDSTPEGTQCMLSGDACQLPGVENGVFNGDAGDLQALIEAGEVEGAPHVAADDVDRSPMTRAEFLNAHGIEETEGWEVHHVQPVAAGGADSVENMVLISPDDHDTVTAAHREFYGWSKKG